MLAVLVVLLSVAIVHGQQLEHLTDQDRQSLIRVFEGALSKPKDVQAVFFGVAGLKLLEQPVPDEKGYCDFINSNVNQNEIASIYAGADIARRLANCKLNSQDALVKKLNEGLTDEQSTQNLYYIAAGLKFLQAKVDNAKLLKALTAAVKKDDSVASLGYAFHTATRLTGDVKAIMDRIEDVVAQADEVDEKYLQFEAGLTVTANVVSGIYSLGEKNNKTAPMKPEEALKFTRFLLSRRSVQLPKPAYHLVRALQFLVKNKHHLPASITLASNLAVHPGNPTVTVKICNILGQTLPAVKEVMLETATHEKSSGVVLSKMPLTLIPDESSKTEYRTNFLTDDRQEGFYSLDISVQSGDKRLIGLQGKLRVKVMTDVSIHNVEVSVTDREQKTTANVINVQYPNKISSLVEADFHQKLMMKFHLKNKKTQEPLVVQQAFVLFRNIQTKQEIIFVAEPDSSKVYKFDIDLFKSADDFDFLSGKYSLHLIIGDAVLSNSFHWQVVDAIKFKFQPHERKTQVQTVSYEPKKKITHEFRLPEKRPSRFLSNAFTGIVLVPLGLLLVLWLLIGVNMGNFLFSIYTLGFHIGLAAIFGLYLLFWMQLNMFQTVRYLVVIGIVTFLSGNAMLRRMAERRLEKKKAQ